MTLDSMIASGSAVPVEVEIGNRRDTSLLDRAEELAYSR